MEYSKEWRKLLLEPKSYKSSDFSSAFPHFGALTKDTVDIISRICEKFNFSSEIEFSSIDSFDFFIAKQFQKIQLEMDSILEISEDNYEEELWKTIKFNFKNEFLLRLVPLVFIVAKFYDVENSEKFQKIPGMLKRANCAVSYQQIVEKEFDIFKVMDFKIIRPVAYESMIYYLNKCELLFSAYKINPHSNMEYVCKSVLRVAYFKRNEIYNRLTPILKETSTINKIKEDQVLLGAASFITALKIINVENSIVLRLVKFISEESPNTIYDIVTLSEEIKVVALNG